MVKIQYILQSFILLTKLAKSLLSHISEVAFKDAYIEEKSKPKYFHHCKENRLNSNRKRIEKAITFVVHK